MERTIAYRVLVPCTEPLHRLQLPHEHSKEHDTCTEQEWETQRKAEVHERWKGTGYKVRLWPPPKWRKDNVSKGA